ncbi:hypothetical protein MUB24_22905 [Lederbergia sp. NSJ-179]|uniref:hypothetical protein n=1 Tax=Lederbergia sp. NSJ-179 TaxID=2931402 RepID=UPI001FD3E968|nr:hypothetical protein [Lederbergia sp. NSJ-179]MCJ7843662.1 hypothetical protein [Lederbergia sp. NSJ-179]
MTRVTKALPQDVANLAFAPLLILVVDPYSCWQWFKTIYPLFIDVRFVQFSKIKLLPPFQ